jgi:hypothetical protein
LSEFTGGNTTNFSSISNWSDVDLVLDADNSKINWTVPIDLNNSSLRFNNYVSFSHNRISVDTSQMPELNHSAILTFKSTGFTGISQFTVLRNGILCPTSICTSYHLDIGGNVELVVTQMSEYSLSESHLINNLGVFAFPALIVLGAGVLLFLFEGLFSGSTDIKKLVEVIIGTLIVLALILSLI